MYVDKTSSILSQGDIFVGLHLIDSAAPKAPSIARNVIVLSHTCDIAKGTNSVVLVCVIRALSEVGPGLEGHIKSGRVFNAMYLRPIGDLGDSFVDFRYVFRVEKDSLAYALEEGLRIASLDEENRLSFVDFFHEFLTRPYVDD